MMKEYTYYAFISYKREDESWAKWLQERLEYYKLPTANADNQAEYIRPVFRDITDLRPGLLSERIIEALDNSKYLIAICSTRYSKSIWCDAEIHRFIETGKAKQIIPFIIDDIPYSDDQECFPPSLRSLREGESELLGADIRPISRDYAFIQVVASMLDVNVDTLWKRHLRFEEEEKQRIKKENDRLLSLQSRITAEKANALFDNWPYDESKAARIALEVLPHDVDYPERPWVPEAEYILRRCITGNFNELSINDRGGIICYSDEFYVCEGVSGPVSIESNQNADYSVRIYDKSGNLFDSLDVKFSIYQLQILSSLNMLIAEDSGTICIYDLESSRKINYIIDSRNFRIDNINMILSIIKTGRQRIDYKLYTKNELIESCISRYGSHELNEADRTLYFLQ